MLIGSRTTANDLLAAPDVACGVFPVTVSPAKPGSHYLKK